MENSLSVRMFTDTRGYERGSRLVNDLCLEISQTPSYTSLQLAHSVMAILIRIQMFKRALFFERVLLLWCSLGALRCAQSLGLVKTMQRARHMKVEFPVKLFFSNVNPPASLN